MSTLKNTSILCSALTCVLPAAEVAGATPNEQRPNIIFILADDLGYMDVCAFAHRVTGTPVDSMFFETPHIDRLVEEGLAFSNAYVCPLSSPTRSSLLTGKYAARLGFTTAMPARDTWYMLNEKPPHPGYAHDAISHEDDIRIEQALINGKSNSAIPAGLAWDEGRKEVVLPEAMEDYHTAFIGKWHVGGFGAEGYQPGDRGFDEVPAYFDAGGSAHFGWRGGWNDRSKRRYPKMPQQEWKIGDAGAESGDSYLTDDLTQKALDYIDRRVAADDGPFFLYFCEFAVHTPIQAKPEDIEYFSNKPTRGWNRQSDPVYAGLVRGLDNSVGRILDKLEEAGIEENTLVVFLSDNGGIDGKITPHDLITNNSPYIGGKATLFEGGVKSPLVFRWKGHIEGGTWDDRSLIDASDLFPTLLEFAGIDPTPYYTEQQIDGRSFYSLFRPQKGRKREAFSRDTLYWHYPFNVIYNNPVDGLPLTPHSAVRVGDMKLIYDWHGRLYLFDMAKDPYETHNLAARRAKDTRRLFGVLVQWLDRNVEARYLPVKNPDYDKSKESRKETPYVDLIEVWRSGGDVVEAATIPDMSQLVIR